MKNKCLRFEIRERVEAMSFFDDLDEKHPLLERHPNESPMDVRVRRTGTPVWAVVGNLIANDWDLKESEGAYLLTAEEVTAVVRYYEEYRSFIDARLTYTCGWEELITKNVTRKMRKVS
jgi:hypothetical protein